MSCNESLLHPAECSFFFFPLLEEGAGAHLGFDYNVLLSWDYNVWLLHQVTIGIDMFFCLYFSKLQHWTLMSLLGNFQRL